MQDRYAGDIGDFVKLGILRSLMPGYRLGVAWWLYPDESHNKDGGHIDYLDQPAKWRTLDPCLFDGLAQIVESGSRCVRALQDAGLLPDAVFHDELIPTMGTPVERRAGRLTWFADVQEAMIGCDLVFLDPDNGLETARYSTGTFRAGKSISLSELAALASPGRTLVVYHHHTRRKGGHPAELAYWADRLRTLGFSTVDAIRSRPYSPRAFFLLNAAPSIRARAKRLTDRWVGSLSWHPDIHTTSDAADPP